MDGTQYCITVPEWHNLPEYSFGAIMHEDVPRAFDSIDDAAAKAQRYREHLPEFHFEIRYFRDNREHPALNWYRGPYDIGSEILKSV